MVSFLSFGSFLSWSPSKTQPSRISRRSRRSWEEEKQELTPDSFSCFFLTLVTFNSNIKLHAAQPETDHHLGAPCLHEAPFLHLDQGNQQTPLYYLKHKHTFHYSLHNKGTHEKHYHDWVTLYLWDLYILGDQAHQVSLSILCHPAITKLTDQYFLLLFLNIFWANQSLKLKSLLCTTSRQSVLFLLISQVFIVN